MLKNLWFRFYKWRAKWRKRKRLLFPSPAEVRLIDLMGGRYITVAAIRGPFSGFPLTIVTSLGLLEREGIEREVRVGAMFIDFATVGLRYHKGIEVDGKNWHRDITREVERDEYLAQYGYAVLHIQAADIYRDGSSVQRKVLNFLAS